MVGSRLLPEQFYLIILVGQQVSGCMPRVSTLCLEASAVSYFTESGNFGVSLSTGNIWMTPQVLTHALVIHFLIEEDEKISKGAARLNLKTKGSVPRPYSTYVA